MNERQALWQISEPLLELSLYRTFKNFRPSPEQRKRPDVRGHTLRPLSNRERSWQTFSAFRSVGFGKRVRLIRHRANRFSCNGNPAGPDDFLDAEGLEQLDQGVNLLHVTHDFNRIRRWR